MTGTETRSRVSHWFDSSDLLLSLFLLTTAHTLWSGYRFGDSNQTIQIPLIKHYADPTLYPGDPLITSGSGHTSLFFPAIGVVVRAVGHLEVLYISLFLAAKFLGLWARWQLSTLIFGNRTSAALLLFLSLGETMSLGGEPLRAPRLTHGELACSLLLWAIVFYLRGRPGVAHLLAGLVFNVHAVFSVTVLAMFALDSLMRAREVGARSLARWWAVCLLLASPTLIWMFRARVPLDPGWVELLRLRAAEHSFPLSSWGLERYSSYLLLLAVAGLGLGGDGRREAEQKLLRFAGAVGILCLAGVVFTEWVPLKAAIQGQLTRSSRILTDLALIYVARVYVRSWESGVTGKAATLLGFLAVFYPIPHGALLPLAVALILLSRARELPSAPVLFTCGALAFYGFAPAEPLANQLGIGHLAATLRRLYQGPVLLCLGLFFVWCLAWRRRRLVAPAAGLVGSVLIAYVIPWQYRSLNERLRQTSWIQVQLWARENTPKTSTFITPPDQAGFRVFSERPVVGEWKDGTMAFFSDRFAFEWWRRMQALGQHDTNFRTFDESHLLEIGRRYGAHYLVFPADRSLGFRQLYRTSDLALYRLEVGPEGTSGPMH